MNWVFPLSAFTEIANGATPSTEALDHLDDHIFRSVWNNANTLSLVHRALTMSPDFWRLKSLNIANQGC